VIDVDTITLTAAIISDSVIYCVTTPDTHFYL